MSKTPSPSSSSDVASSEKRQIFRGARIIFLFTLISRILGAIRDITISSVFGAGLVTDAFYQAFTIPNMFRRLTAEGAMTLAFIPIYVEIREKNIAETKRFACQVLGLVLWTTFFLTALGMIFSPQLVFLVSGGFQSDPEKFQLTVDLTRLMFPYLILVSVVAWAMGVLNAEKRFAAPAAAPIFLNLGIIGAAVFLSPQLEQPIVGIGIGVLVGGIVQVFLQFPDLWKIAQSIRPRWPWGDPYIAKLLQLLGPALFGIAVYQINIIVLRRIASYLPEGQVTYYYNANRLTELALGVFAFAFTTASFPELSSHTIKTDWEKARQTLKFTFISTMFIITPATLGLIAAAEPIISMMYLRGNYLLLDVQQTIPVLQAFAPSIPAVALIRLLVTVFYAIKDTKTPVVISAVSLVVTGLLGWWWSQSLEVVGLALALSAGTWFQFILLAFFVSRRPGLGLRWISWDNVLKYTLSASIIGGYAWQVAQWGIWNEGSFLLYNWGIFFVTIGGAAILYFGLLLLMRESQALQWLQWFKQWVKR